MYTSFCASGKRVVGTKRTGEAAVFITIISHCMHHITSEERRQPYSTCISTKATCTWPGPVQSNPSWPSQPTCTHTYHTLWYFLPPEPGATHSSFFFFFTTALCSSRAIAIFGFVGKRFPYFCFDLPCPALPCPAIPPAVHGTSWCKAFSACLVACSRLPSRRESSRDQDQDHNWHGKRGPRPKTRKKWTIRKLVPPPPRIRCRRHQCRCRCPYRLRLRLSHIHRRRRLHYRHLRRPVPSSKCLLRQTPPPSTPPPCKTHRTRCPARLPWALSFCARLGNPDPSFTRVASPSRHSPDQSSAGRAVLSSQIPLTSTPSRRPRSRLCLCLCLYLCPSLGLCLCHCNYLAPAALRIYRAVSRHHQLILDR
jgi:hypothetical protein